MAHGHCRPATRRTGSSPRGAHGFTLISVLVAMLLVCMGLLGMAKAMLGVTAASTQNQNVTAIASLSNSFYGIVQSDPVLVVDPAFQATYTASNISSAPAALRAWLTQATNALPSGSITIATGPDAGSGVACAVASGCTVTLNMQWSQVAMPGQAGSTRSQNFYYQFGF